ncbi:MAG: hypothetical protein HQL69_16900 [Magnetococcales bacterium]|nr:hypothetical protein [Magnetococcales bacterium]
MLVVQYSFGSKPKASKDDFKSGGVEEIHLTSLKSNKPLEFYQETLKRPIFSQTRRPIAQKNSTAVEPIKPKVTPTTSDTPPKVTLLGVMFYNSFMKALICKENCSSPEWVSTSDKIDEWAVTKVMPTSVVLNNGKQEEVILLTKGNATPPPATQAIKTDKKKSVKKRRKAYKRKANKRNKRYRKGRNYKRKHTSNKRARNKK